MKQLIQEEVGDTMESRGYCGLLFVRPMRGNYRAKEKWIKGKLI